MPDAVEIVFEKNGLINAGPMDEGGQRRGFPRWVPNRENVVCIVSGSCTGRQT